MISKTNLVLAFFVAAVLAGIFLQYGPVIPVPRENFMQKPVGVPLASGGMGPYDGVSVGDISGFMATEPTIGSAPVGTPADKNKLMLLVGNKTSPECCPASFNTDTGCVCLTEQDRTLFASRGGNRA